ncbi:MAG: hypothetical protein JWN14_2481, partial [Chthonomonadales bacterium]|nr:hypothetical protein [Chthonomonadales bacterium]
MFNKIRCRIVAALFLAPCALSGATAAHAQNIFLPDDTTLDASNHVDPPFSATVGWASFDDEINGVNPTSPTISIVTGASVNQLEVTNSSIINMSGGSVGSGDFLGRLRSSDTSTVNISGGNVLYVVDAQSASTVNFSGGTVA